jgi:hypothetical protein
MVAEGNDIPPGDIDDIEFCAVAEELTENLERLPIGVVTALSDFGFNPFEPIFAELLDARYGELLGIKLLKEQVERGPDVMGRPFAGSSLLEEVGDTLGLSLVSQLG